jgi:uncharacterized RDD family membrane protein YckC
MAEEPTVPPEPPSPRRPRSIPARLLQGSARGARGIASATGIDEAVEIAAEEAIVRAVESVAVERALQRVLDGPAVEEAVERAMNSPAVERALVNAIDSEMIDRVWERLLASDEAQQLVVRVAEAPEVRNAITAQGVGLIEDIGRQIARIAGRLDNAIETIVRRVLRRRGRDEPTNAAGLVSRGLAALIDAAILNGIFFVLTGILAFVVSALFGTADEASAPTIVLGATAWSLAGSAYLITFWSLAGETPGMRFLDLEIVGDQDRGLGLRRSVRRLAGLILSIVPFGAGLLAALFDPERRGWHDRIADTRVVHVDEPMAIARRGG